MARSNGWAPPTRPPTAPRLSTDQVLATESRDHLQDMLEQLKLVTLHLSLLNDMVIDAEDLPK